MLTCLYGRAGSGKSRFVTEAVVRHAQRQQDAVLIVPEQYTFSAERLLMQQIRSHGLLTVQVLSPSRLAHRVLGAVGAPRADLLDASGALMVFTRLLRDLGGQLRHYNRMRDVQSLASRMHDLIRSLKQADVDAPAFLALAGQTGDAALMEKAHDIALVYQAYEDYLEKARLSDDAALQRRLIDALAQADFLRACTVYADGFDLIAPLTLRLLCALSKQCQNVYVTFPCPREPGRDAALFYPAQNAMRRLCAMAREQGVTVQTQALEPHGDRVPALAHLERELFAAPGQVYAAPAPQIVFAAAPNPPQEAAMTAGLIVELAREQGVHYGQMAVVCADSGERARALARQLALRGVPFMTDHVQNAGEHPGVRALLGAIGFAASGMTDRQALWRVVKSGYTGLEEDALDLFENAVVSGNLFASRLMEPIDQPEAEHARAALIGPLHDLALLLKKGETAQDYAAAAYRYLTGSGLMAALCQGGQEPAANVICTVLDQSHRLLGPMPLRGYLLALQNGFAAARLGEIPQMADAVSISTFDRFKGDAIRALFVMGANSGLLPSTQAPASLLSDQERAQMGAYLGPGGAEYFALENLTVYGTLAQSAGWVAFSYSLRTVQGEALEPGELVRRAQRLFPQARRIGPNQSAQASLMLTDWPSAKKQLGPMLRQGTDRLWRAVFRRAQRIEPVFAQRVEQTYLWRPAPARLMPQEALTLFGARQSISRLETYAACPYAHFLQYGLNPQILREPALLKPDEGSFYHEALDRFTRLCAPGGFDLTDQQAAERMGQVVAPLCQALERRAFARTALGKAQIRRMAQTAVRAAVEMTWHIRRSAFMPLASEISFGMGGPYPAIELDAGGVQLVLQGRIDRVDVAQVAGQDYLRIVDYKTGRNQLSFARVETGTQLQLLTYLDAVTRQRGQQGAGAFYLRLTGDTTALAPGALPDDQTLRACLRRTYRLEGIANDDRAVLAAMAPQGGLSDLVGVRIKKDGTPYAGAPVVSQQQMRALSAYVRHKAQTLSAQMIGGQIEPEPLKTGQILRCQWCDYRSACPHDPLLGGRIRRCAQNEADARARVLAEGEKLLEP